MPVPTNAIINPDADHILRRIALRYGILVLILLVAETFLLSYLNLLLHAVNLQGPRRFVLDVLNGASILIVLVPFYAGIYRLFTARLEIGRERIAARAWSEAVAALEPFAAPTQRFLDRSGEAHFLLAQAYMGMGDKVKAEAARAFVRRRKGVWAEKLGTGKGAGVYSAPGQENRPRPPKSKPRRRF